MTEQVTDTPTPDAAAAAAVSEAEQNANKAEDLLGDETPEAAAKPDEAGKGDKAGAEKSDAKGTEKGEGAPEKYEPFTIPEGIERDDTAIAAFEGLARKHNLSQAAAQELVDLQTASLQRNADAAWQVWADKQNEWAAEVRNDKEFGGINFDTSKAAAKAFVTKYGGKEAKELLAALKITGASNHPAVFRALARAGKDLAEDVILSGSSGGEGPRDRAKVLFPNQN